MGLLTGHCFLRLHLDIIWVHDGILSCRKCGCIMNLFSMSLLQQDTWDTWETWCFWYISEESQTTGIRICARDPEVHRAHSYVSVGIPFRLDIWESAINTIGWCVERLATPSKWITVSSTLIHLCQEIIIIKNVLLFSLWCTHPNNSVSDQVLLLMFNYVLNFTKIMFKQASSCVKGVYLW